MSSSPHAQGNEGDDDVFPGWLLREMEFRQLASAEPSALERRREEAATWIKQEVLLVRAMEKFLACVVSSQGQEEQTTKYGSGHDIPGWVH